jgi:hypothetical protein
MKCIKTIWTLLAMMIAMVSCKDKYRPDIEYPNTGYLVVEGFINSGQGNTNIKLSRTVKVTDATAIKYENNATVRVEGNNNTSYPLSPQGNGLYTVGTLPLNDANKYRLYIRTSSGTEYRSEFSSIIRTPDIDSISWTREEGSGLQIHINTHDPNNKTWYYTWNYDETWEYRAVYYPSLKYITNPPPGRGLGVDYLFPDKGVDTANYRCWSSSSSTSIVLGSSKKLSSDVIHLPLFTIEEASIKLSWLYSIIVHQHGLSERGYDFLQRMKKNTEQVGSIFDAQPSELNSNIHNLANPKEPVIGFIDVSNGWEKRIFIYARDVPRWSFRLGCDEIVVLNNPDSIAAYSDHNPIGPVDIQNGRIANFKAAYPICTDCRVGGGKTVKPSFWPN